MNLARATAKVSMLTAGGYVVGLAVQVLFARRFGAEGATDAWFAASAVPNFLAVVLFASLAKACVPVFVDRLALGTETARRTLNGLASVTFLGLSLLAGAVSLAAEPISRALFPDFDSGTYETARELLRISIWAVPAVGTSLVLAAWLQARRRFGIAAVAGLLPPTGVLLALLLLPGSFPPGREVGCMAVGLAGGAWLQLLFFGALVYRPRPLLRGFPDAGTASALRRALPLFAAAGLIALYPVLEKRFASGLAEGAVAWLGFGRRPLNLLLILLAVPAATTTYTAFAETASRGDLPGLRNLAWRGAVVLLLVLVPAGVFFAVHAEEILRIVYERGRFLPADTIAAAAALRLLLPVILLAAAAHILAQTFLARGKVLAPLLAAAAGVAAYVALGPTVANRWGYRGLAVLQGAALGVTVLLVLLFLLRDLGLPLGEGVVRSLGEIAIAGGVCFACAWFSKDLLSAAEGSAWLRIPLLAVLAAIVGAVYLGTLSVLRNRHLAEILRGLFARDS